MSIELCALLALNTLPGAVLVRIIAESDQKMLWNLLANVITIEVLSLLEVVYSTSVKEREKNFNEKK